MKQNVQPPKNVVPFGKK